MIYNETETDKKIIAKTIHQLNPRHDKPLIKINYTTIPANLLKNKLFNHNKKTFTNTINTHRNRFKITDNDTLFLDKINDLPLKLQPKLLHILQKQKIKHLDENKTIPINIKIITATNRNL